MAAPDGNPYLAALAGLDNALFPALPDGYKGRLTVQLVMCGIVIILCIVYLTMSVLDLRKRGKRLRLIRLQQLAGANGHRLIVLNSLFCFIVLYMTATVILVLNKWREWEIHLNHGSSKYFALLSTMVWWFSMLSSWCFTFANVAATLQVRSKGRGFEAASWLAVVTHNAALVGLIIVYACVMVPLSVMADYWNNKSDVEFSKLRVMLNTAAAAFDVDPTASDPTLLASIATTQAAGQEYSAKYLTYFKPAVYTASSFACLFAVLNCVSFYLVLALRRQTKWYRTRTANVSESIFVTRDQRTQVDEHIIPPPAEIPDLNAFTGSSTLVGDATQRTVPFGTSNGAGVKSSKKAVNSAESDNIALTRLATDLAIGVPMVLLVSIYFTVSGILGMTKFGVSPQWTEFIVTTYGWAHLIVGIACVTFFIINMVVNSGRYGTFSGGDGATSGSRMFTTNKFDAVSRGQHSVHPGAEMPIELQIHTNGESSTYRTDKMEDAAQLGDDEKWM